MWMKIEPIKNYSCKLKHVNNIFNFLNSNNIKHGCLIRISNDTKEIDRQFFNIHICMSHKKLISYKLVYEIKNIKYDGRYVHLSLCDTLVPLYSAYLIKINDLTTKDDDADDLDYIEEERIGPYLNRIKDNIKLIGNISLEFKI